MLTNHIGIKVKDNVKFLTDIIKVDGKLVAFFEGSQGEKLELVEHLKL